MKVLGLYVVQVDFWVYKNGVWLKSSINSNRVVFTVCAWTYMYICMKGQGCVPECYTCTVCVSKCCCIETCAEGKQRERKPGQESEEIEQKTQACNKEILDNSALRCEEGCTEQNGASGGRSHGNLCPGRSLTLPLCTTSGAQIVGHIWHQRSNQA